MLEDPEYETIIRCPDCGKPMHQLEGTYQPIYVCSHCGASIDQKTVDERRKIKKENEGNNGLLLWNLFSEPFMKKYTEFNHFKEFIDHCKFFNHCMGQISKETLADVPSRKINRYVRKHTCFTSWDQMFEKAVDCYLKM